ncbi:MAG: TonB C-terminal domain-containing protein [Myxococcales bacterium]|nr:TonB C-terminal domain-containing protein [Myxococcales bacterium]
MRRPPTSRAGLWALLGSLALHLAFVGWVVTRPALPVEPLRLPDGTLVYVDLAPRAPPPEAEPPPGPKKEVTTKAVPPPSTGQAEAAETDVPLADNPLADAPRAIPPPGSLGSRVLLLPGSSFTVSLDAGTLEAEARPGSITPRSPEQLVDELAKETLGRGRVERGLVHPYYSQLGKALLKTWDAERVAKSGLKGLGEQFVQNSKIYNELWADRASAYGRGGSPIDSEQLAPNRRPQPNDRIQGIQGIDLEARKELSRELASAFKATRRAIIRVVQDSSGKLVRVELVQPSNDSQVDKEALKDVQAAAQKLPAPPEEALMGREQLSSLWSFELIVSITPPMPVFTFEFDEALGFIDARLPLDRRIYKKVRLVSVE